MEGAALRDAGSPSTRCCELTMRAGVGREDITPPVGIPAGGWGNQVHEISEGNDLELWATVLVVEGADGSRAALADIDLCLLDDAQAARARAVIAQAAGLPEDRVAVGTTHNHSVPVTLELGERGSGATESSWRRTSSRCSLRSVVRPSRQSQRSGRCTWVRVEEALHSRSTAA